MYEYSYEDDIVKKMVAGPAGEPVPSIRAKNRHLFNNCPVEYDTSTGKCIIYSKKPVDGLTLKKKLEGQTPMKSIIKLEDMDKLEVTE